jgi:uncharacterized protein (DUF427 family)
VKISAREQRALLKPSASHLFTITNVMQAGEPISVNTRRIEPQPGQESVWDYPRPPRLEDSPKHIKIVFNGVTIADTQRAKRVLETSHPPVYYIPPEDIKMEYLSRTTQGSFCEWKGGAIYYTVVVGDKQAGNAAWSYPSPTPSFASIKDYLAFYPSRMEACYVNDEQVQAQPGDFYGGWITKDIVGPFKGSLGTWGW